MSHDNRRVERQAKLAAGIAIVVIGVWACAALASLYTTHYEPLSIVTPVVMIVVGFLFGYRNGIGGKRRNDG